ncbi:3-deoxy-7-phosphoheptulonate synthase [Luminiphilus sp.]|nr:3-deoxy-7-phosphoheptulonate synthase [Luminiphilus sp.]
MDNNDKEARHNRAMEKQKAAVDAGVAAATTDRGVAVLLTGDGKGKTSSAFGMVLRALGYNQNVGFKNGTDGDVQMAVDAIGAARQPHHFLSVTKEGQSAIFETLGNEDCHVILRGGHKPNYDMFAVDDARALLSKAGLPDRLMIDASHANSRKQPERQLEVLANIGQQVAGGNEAIIGVMIESFLEAGRQNVVAGGTLTYGQSITDPCIDWAATEDILTRLAENVAQRRLNRSVSS